MQIFCSDIIVDILMIFFVMLECEDHAKKFLRYMNFHHPNFQFTFEGVCNDKLTFLYINN